jgi:hypothetical protein
MYGYPGYYGANQGYYEMSRMYGQYVQHAPHSAYQHVLPTQQLVPPQSLPPHYLQQQQQQQQVPPKSTASETALNNNPLSKWFGESILQLQSAALPPVPSTRFISVEELEKKSLRQ